MTTATKTPSKWGPSVRGYAELLNWLFDALNDPSLIYAENNGIGHYEAWGMKGFDKGQDYPVFDGPEDFVIEFNGPEEEEPADDETFTISHDLGDVRLRVKFETLKRMRNRAYILCTVEQLRD